MKKLHSILFPFLLISCGDWKVSHPLRALHARVALPKTSVQETNVSSDILTGALSVTQIVDTTHNTYYVSITGDDSNPGTLAQPFKTIQKAAEIMVAGDTCYIRGGTYRETVVPRNSGTLTDKITFINYPNELVTISGTEVITGWSSEAGSNYYKAPIEMTLGDGNQVFINGAVTDIARWPNNTGTLFQPTYAIADGGSNTTLVDSELATAPTGFETGAKIWYLGGAEWTSWIVGIDRFNAHTNSLTIGLRSSKPSVNANYDPKAGNPYYIFDSKNLLDAPNEFYYDANEKMLYLIAPRHADPTSMTVEAKKKTLRHKSFW